MKTKTRTRHTKPAPKKLIEPRPVSAELRAGIDQFAKALARQILVKIDPEAARWMAEEPT
jgi:hypothetical protein